MVNSAHTSKRTKKEDQPELTGGEHVFDLVNYYGIGWGMNTALSVWASDMAFLRPNHPVYNFTSAFVGAGQKLGEMLTHDDNLKEITERTVKTLNGLKESGALNNDKAAEALELINKGSINLGYYKLRDELGNGNLAEGLQQISKLVSSELPNDVGESANAIAAGFKNAVKGEVSKEVMKSLAGIMALCAGGFLLMYPVKKLEDNKVHVTKWLDEHVVDPFNALTGKAPKTEEEKQALQEKRQARYDYLEHDAPRQSWASILTGRIAALIPLYILHVSWWKPNNAIKAMGGAMAGVEANPDPEHGFGGANKWLEGPGEWAAGKAYQFEPVKNFAEWASQGAVNPKTELPFESSKEWTEAIGGLVSSDMIYSFIAAMGTEHISKAMTEMWADKKCSEAPEIPEKIAKEEPLSAKAAVEKLERSLKKEADVDTIPEMEKLPQRKVEQASRQGSVMQDRGMEAEQLAFA